MKRVLLITTASKTNDNLTVVKDFTVQLNDDLVDVHFDTCAVQELLFVVQGSDIRITLGGQELRAICDVIHLRNTHLFFDYANALRLYADQSGIELVNRADATLPYYGKVSQGFLLAVNGIPTPSFVSAPSNQTLIDILPTLDLEYPIVVKHNDTTKGLHNYLVKDAEEGIKILKDERDGFLIQSFIPNEGELRVLRFGEYTPPLVFKKQAVAGTYLNNTSQGGSVVYLTPEAVDPAVLRQAIEASRLMGRDIGGVDVLLGNDGQFYILEVNLTPAIASGAFSEEKRKLYSAFFRQDQEDEEEE